MSATITTVLIQQPNGNPSYEDRYQAYNQCIGLARKQGKTFAVFQHRTGELSIQAYNSKAYKFFGRRGFIFAAIATKENS